MKYLLLVLNMLTATVTVNGYPRGEGIGEGYNAKVVAAYRAYCLICRDNGWDEPTEM